MRTRAYLEAERCLGNFGFEETEEHNPKPGSFVKLWVTIGCLLCGELHHFGYDPHHLAHFSPLLPSESPNSSSFLRLAHGSNPTAPKPLKIELMAKRSLAPGEIHIQGKQDSNRFLHLRSR
jgi:hypothetical protein